MLELWEQIHDDTLAGFERVCLAIASRTIKLPAMAESSAELHRGLQQQAIVTP